MDPWHRFRLLVCLAVMVAVLGAGGFAWLAWGVPPAAFGFLKSPASEVPRRVDPLLALHWTIDCGQMTRPALPTWKTVPDKEFERELRKLCESVTFVDELVLHLQAAKADYEVRPANPSADNLMGRSAVHVWIDGITRSLMIHYNDKTRAITKVRVVNTFL